MWKTGTVRQGCRNREPRFANRNRQSRRFLIEPEPSQKPEPRFLSGTVSAIFCSRYSATVGGRPDLASGVPPDDPIFGAMGDGGAPMVVDVEEEEGVKDDPTDINSSQWPRD